MDIFEYPPQRSLFGLTRPQTFRVNDESKEGIKKNDEQNTKKSRASMLQNVEVEVNKTQGIVVGCGREEVRMENLATSQMQ